MSPTARKVARLIGELESVARRLKNLIPELQELEFENKARKAELEAAKGTPPIAGLRAVGPGKIFVED